MHQQHRTSGRVAGAFAHRIAYALLLVAGALCVPVSATEPAQSTAPQVEKCLSIVRIDQSKIVDSRHMLFTTADRRMYLNTLPRDCPGMHPGDTYMFSTALSQLCNVDIITILNPAGVGFLRGPSCGLGMFEPVTQEQVETLQREARGR